MNTQKIARRLELAAKDGTHFGVFKGSPGKGMGGPGKGKGAKPDALDSEASFDAFRAGYRAGVITGTLSAVSPTGKGSFAALAEKYAEQFTEGNYDDVGDKQTYLDIVEDGFYAGRKASVSIMQSILNLIDEPADTAYGRSGHS